MFVVLRPCSRIVSSSLTSYSASFPHDILVALLCVVMICQRLCSRDIMHYDGWFNAIVVARRFYRFVICCYNWRWELSYFPYIAAVAHIRLISFLFILSLLLHFFSLFLSILSS